MCFFKKTLFSSVLLGMVLLNAGTAIAQTRPAHYLSQAHSHNDYIRDNPFFKAYGLGFGSIEVDLFLVDGVLYVAHDRADITPDRTFDKLYLEPILQRFKASQGESIYPQNGQLQLLIDPKTEGAAILQVLTQKLTPYRDLFDVRNNSNAVKIVISGNKPDPKEWSEYDDIFYFDGDFGVNYTTNQLRRIGLFSAPLSNYSNWTGTGQLSNPDKQRITGLVDSVHRLDKKIRFWAVPDTEHAWQQWLDIGIDYINTDKPEALSMFLGHRTWIEK